MTARHRGNIAYIKDYDPWVSKERAWRSDEVERTGPLKDLRVIEMGQPQALLCGQLLADFGAEVIKLEQPKVGDPMREWGRERPYGKSLWWPVVARNKKSVTLNLREPEGRGDRP